jgi:hypothetical protein
MRMRQHNCAERLSVTTGKLLRSQRQMLIDLLGLLTPPLEEPAIQKNLATCAFQMMR